MTENLDPQTATRAALGAEIDRLRRELTDAIAWIIGNEELRTADARTRESLGKQRFLNLYEDVAMAVCDCSPDEDLFPLVTHGPQCEAVLAIVRPYLDGQAWADIEAQRDVARRDLAAATTALGRIRKLCDAVYPHALVHVDRIRALLPAAGDDPAATGGGT